MANMPQTMQVAATTDPMVAFQLAQMCFAPPPSAFPPFPPQPDPVAIQPRLRPPNLPPKPIFDPTPKSNPKLTPAVPSTPSSTLQGGNQRPTPTSTSASDPSVTIEMDLLVLKQKRLARRFNIGWIPEPGFPDRGCFNLVPTPSYLHWSSSGEVTEPDPRRSLVMEDLPLDFRTTWFVRSWSDQFSAVAVHLNGGGKALIEFSSRVIAEEAYDSPRLRDGLYKRATHVRVFWYRPQTEGVASSTSTTSGNTGATREAEDAITANTAPEGPVSTDANNPTPLVETSQLGEKARSKGKGRGFSLPPERDMPNLDFPVRSSTAPTSTSRPESPFVTIRSAMAYREQRRRSGPVDRTTNGFGEGPELTPSRPPTSPSPSISSGSRTKVPSPRLRSPSTEVIQQERTPTGSPPSLRYPSSTPEMTGSATSTNEETPTQTHDNPPPASTSGPSVTGDTSLEQQLRMRLLAMKRTRIANRSSEQSSPTSTPTTVVDPEPETLFKTASPSPVSQTHNGIVVSESLDLLATSFITDTLKAAQGLPSEPEVFDAAINARLKKKRGSNDAFGSSADIASKRQRLAQQIEESKRIMGQWMAAKTKEERNRIFALWEESNRFVSLTCVDCALILPHDLFSPLFLGPWNCFRNPQPRHFSGHVMRKGALSSTATMRTS